MKAEKSVSVLQVKNNNLRIRYCVRNGLSSDTERCQPYNTGKRTVVVRSDEARSGPYVPLMHYKDNRHFHFRFIPANRCFAVAFINKRLFSRQLLHFVESVMRTGFLKLKFLTTSWQRQPVSPNSDVNCTKHEQIRLIIQRFGAIIISETLDEIGWTLHVSVESLYIMFYCEYCTQLRSYSVKYFNIIDSIVVRDSEMIYGTRASALNNTSP